MLTSIVPVAGKPLHKLWHGSKCSRVQNQCTSMVFSLSQLGHGSSRKVSPRGVNSFCVYYEHVRFTFCCKSSRKANPRSCFCAVVRVFPEDAEPLPPDKSTESLALVPKAKLSMDPNDECSTGDCGNQELCTDSVATMNNRKAQSVNVESDSNKRKLLISISGKISQSGIGDEKNRIMLVDAILQMLESMSVPVLDRYLMGEMVPVFILAVGLCSTLGMSLGALAGLVREVVVSGLPLRVAGSAALLQLPYFAAVSMPMVCLAATLFGIGRLQADMECVALFAAGLPLWRMLVTPLCLCLVAAALKLACHECLVPYGSSQARKLVDAALTTHMQGLRQTEDLIYPEYAVKAEVGEDGALSLPRRMLQRIWYASKMDGTRLSGLLLLEILPSGHVHQVVLADDGEWRANESSWKFSNSTLLDVSPYGMTRRILQVEGLQVPSTRLTSGRALQIPTLQELSRSDIKQEIAILRAKLHARSPSNHNSFRGIDSETNISHQEAEDISILSTEGMKIAQKKDKEDILEMGETSKIKYRAETGIEENKLAKLECFLHQRDAAAFSCLLYGMIGATVSLAQSAKGSRSASRTTPFTWALLCIAVYNASSAMGAVLGSSRVLTPFLSAWLPPIVPSAVRATCLLSLHRLLYYACSLPALLGHKRFVMQIVRGTTIGSSVASVSGMRLTQTMVPKNSQDIQDMQDIPYANAVGSLMHAMVSTRLYLAFAMDKLLNLWSIPASFTGLLSNVCSVIYRQQKLLEFNMEEQCHILMHFYFKAGLTQIGLEIPTLVSLRQGCCVYSNLVSTGSGQVSLPVAASTPSIIIQHGADLSCVKQPKPLVAEGDEVEDAWSNGTISELDRAIVLHSSRASSNVITNTRVGEAGNCTQWRTWFLRQIFAENLSGTIF